jgi:hypothetical protein
MAIDHRSRANDADGPVAQEYVRLQYARPVNGKAYRDLRAENLRRFQAFQRRIKPTA